MYSVNKFRHYLLGKKFTFHVVQDHSALLYLVSKASLTGKLAKWTRSYRSSYSILSTDRELNTQWQTTFQSWNPEKPRREWRTTSLMVEFWRSLRSRVKKKTQISGWWIWNFSLVIEYPQRRWGGRNWKDSECGHGPIVYSMVTYIISQPMEYGGE